MHRRDALKTLTKIAGVAAFARTLPGCLENADLQLEEAEQSLDSLVTFQLLQSNVTRTTWSHIVPGRFTATNYDSLFLYEASTGTAELRATNGAGAISTTTLGTFTKAQLGNRNWTHVVPGYFGPSGYMGLLLYDKVNGVGEFYDSTGSGGFSLLRHYTGWRTSWSHVVPGYYKHAAVWDNVQTNETYTGLLFYDSSAGYIEIWTTDGTGMMSLYESFNGFGSSWTNLVGGNFLPNNDNDQFTQVLAYNSTLGSACFYYGSNAGGAITQGFQLGVGYSDLVAGNFGGPGLAMIACFKRSTGVVTNVLVNPDYTITAFDSPVYPATTTTQLAAGNFYSSDPEDYNFYLGDQSTNEERRNWRAAASHHADYLFYSASLGKADIYLHETTLPTPPVVSGYITSTTALANGPSGVSTGSVKPGEAIAFHLSGPAGAATVKIYRAPDFTTVKQILNVTLASQVVQRTSYRNGAGWPVTGTTFTVPASWTSGLYIARLTSGTSSVDIPFVVRSSSPASQAKLLFVVDDTTYEAYNDWGGRSLYRSQSPFDTGSAVWPQGGARAPYAFQVSFDRPHTGLYDTYNAKWTHWEVPFVTWCEQNNIALEYCTSRDLHFVQPSANYRALVFVGHNEYWTVEMRLHAGQFAYDGGALNFLAGNVCWWQVRLSSDGKAMTCYKNAWFDPPSTTQYQLSTPEGAVFTSSRSTTQWFAPGVGYSEAFLTGVSYNGTPIYNDDTTDPYVAQTPSHLLLGGTGLVANSTFGQYLVGGVTHSVIGSETDRTQPTTSASFVTVASVTVPGPQSAANLGQFTTGNGTIFTAATMNWTLGLAYEPNVAQITRNALTSGRWRKTDVIGSANDIGISANGTIWIIGNTPNGGNFDIYRWDGATPWVIVSGLAKRIAVDPAGNPWVVNAAGGIYQWSGGGFTIQRPGAATDIGIGANGQVWVTGTTLAAGGYPIYYWNGSNWVQVDGIGVRIAVDAAGAPWLVNSEGKIFYRSGGISGAWVERTIYSSRGDGNYVVASDIGVGSDGSVWVASSGGAWGTKIYRWDGVHWACVYDVGAMAVAVTPGGAPWFVSTSHGISYLT